MSFTGPLPTVCATFAAITDVGRHRTINQDTILVSDLGEPGETPSEARLELRPTGLLLAVCDGMGGGQGGEVASGLAAAALRRSLLAAEPPTSPEQAGRTLMEAIEGTNDVVRAMTLQMGLRESGTTATVALVVGDRVLVGQVGDSRAYLLRAGRLHQLTRDQSLMQQMIEAGLLRPEDARDFDHGNIILQALGTSSSVLVDITWAQLRAGDQLMLCSDGLWGEVEHDRMASLMAQAPTPAEACKQLVAAANEAGGTDNISCIVARFDGDGLRHPARDEPTPGYQKLLFQEAPQTPTLPPDQPEAINGSTSPPHKPPRPPIDDDPPTVPLRSSIGTELALLLTCAAALGFVLLRCVG